MAYFYTLRSDCLTKAQAARLPGAVMEIWEEYDGWWVYAPYPARKNPSKVVAGSVRYILPNGEIMKLS